MKISKDKIKLILWKYVAPIPFLILIVYGLVVVFMAGYNTVSYTANYGIKGVIQAVWCGKDIECKKTFDGIQK
jgi:hypothetical protein